MDYNKLNVQNPRAKISICLLLIFQNSCLFARTSCGGPTWALPVICTQGKNPPLATFSTRLLRTFQDHMEFCQPCHRLTSFSLMSQPDPLVENVFFSRKQKFMIIHMPQMKNNFNTHRHTHKKNKSKYFYHAATCQEPQSELYIQINCHGNLMRQLLSPIILTFQIKK